MRKRKRPVAQSAGFCLGIRRVASPLAPPAGCEICRYARLAADPVKDGRQVKMDSGEAGVGYGSSILRENSRPIVALSFATREDAEQTRAGVAKAVEKAVEITPQA